MIEAFWRSLKHAAFSGQTPDEMYFGTAADLPAELAAAKSRAWTARLAANRVLAYDQCLGRRANYPEPGIPP